jgi:hypothetical protein
MRLLSAYAPFAGGLRPDGLFLLQRRTTLTCNSQMFGPQIFNPAGAQTIRNRLVGLPRVPTQ